MRSWLFAKVVHALSCVNEPLYGWLNALANLCYSLKDPEKVVHLGSLHPDKTLYVIHHFPNDTGLASWYDKVLGCVQQAEKKGWVSVIAPSRPDEHPFGDWYTYFDRLSSVDPADVSSSRNVVFETSRATIYKRYNPAEVARRHAIASRVPMNAETQLFVQKRFAALFGSSAAGMIGAYYRGTDYRMLPNWRPIGHSAVPDIQVFCDRLEADARRWNIPVDEGSPFFIVTEEQEALDAIRRRFPKCRFVDKERFSNFRGETGICQTRLTHTSPIDNNRLYLLDLYILSRCDYLVGALNSGLLMAINLNGNAYKGVDILKTGVNR